MGAFGSIIAGAGNAAGKYGEQVRGLLEQRREALAGNLIQLAQRETDPSTRESYVGAFTDLISGKPMGGVAQSVVKAAQARAKDQGALDNALKSVGGGTGAIPPVQPAGPKMNTPPAATSNRDFPVPASMPGSSPVQPIQQNSTPIPNMTSVPEAQPQAQQAPPPVQMLQAPPQPQAPPPDMGMPGGLTPEMLSKTPAGREMMAPLIQNYAELQRAKQLAQQELTWKRAALDQEKTSPQWDRIPDIQKVEYEMWASTPGQAMPSMGAAAMYMPRVISPSMLGSQAPPGSMEFGTQNLLDPTSRYREEYNPMTGQNIFIPLSPETSLTQTPGGLQLSNRLTGTSIAPVQGALPPGMNTPHQEVTPGGGIGFISPVQAQGGQPLSMVSGAVAPSFATPHVGVMPNGQQGMFNAAGATGQGGPFGAGPLPTGTTVPSLMPIRTTSVQNEPGHLPTTTETTRTRGGANGGLTPAPMSPLPPVNAPSVGTDKLMSARYMDWADGKFSPDQKGLTALQSYASQHGLPTPTTLSPDKRMQDQTKLGIYDVALGRMQAIKSDLPLLNNLLDAGKLTLETDSDGFIRAAINRVLPMTPEESRLVSNFRSMMEDINLLRGPLGGTGFRGPEAWKALQAQRGQLMARPEITAGVLDNSLAAMQKLRDPLAKTLSVSMPGQGGQSGPVQVKTAEDYNKLPSGTVYIDPDGKQRTKK